MKTLIVEDDFYGRLLLQEFLRPYGESHVAVNGKEAVEAYTRSLEEGCPYDLICMDIMMPEMDGQTALIEIHNVENAYELPIEKRVKVVMTTALSDMKNVSRAYQNLCDGYLAKPFLRAKLVETLRNLQLISEG